MLCKHRKDKWWIFWIACCFFLGIVFIPGTSQLTAKDILYRLQASKAKCIVTNDTLAPAVESVMSECRFLKTKLIVAKGSRDGWLNLKELFAWVQLFYQHLCEIKEAVLVRWCRWVLGFLNTDELHFSIPLPTHCNHFIKYKFLQHTFWELNSGFWASPYSATCQLLKCFCFHLQSQHKCTEY